MEQYDFTDTGNTKDIYGLLDYMSGKELKMVREVVRNICETAQLAQYERYKVWFDRTLLPIFRGYIQMASFLLQIERDNRITNVPFRNSGGLDIAENCKGMYMALIMAIHISLDSDAGDLVLVLAYDCHRIVSRSASRSSCAREISAPYPSQSTAQDVYNLYIQPPGSIPGSPHDNGQATEKEVAVRIIWQRLYSQEFLQRDSMA